MTKNFDLNISELPEVSREATRDYVENTDKLIEMVNNDLKKRDDLEELIGNNSVQVMVDNHENHARFMANVFKLNNYEMLLDTIVWVYRTYRRHGFSYDYFPVELKAWSRTVERELGSRSANQINRIYSFMLDNHERFVELAEKGKETGLENLSDMAGGVTEDFLDTLLAGDSGRSLEIARENVGSREDVGSFFEDVIRPAMYEVGSRWEDGKISVAEEHLASSIVSRVISGIYSQFIKFKYTKGKAVVTATANEFHEIGSRIIADSLELDGWDADHLGVNTPTDDLLELLIDKQPHFLGLSVAIPFNLDAAIETIERINNRPELKDMKVLIGGKAFNDNPDLWKDTGADAYSRNSKEAIRFAREWWRKYN